MMNRVRVLWLTAACLVALPALAGEAPLPGPTPRVGAPPPGVPLVAERHVPSTELGFERGIGPAAGQTVSWRGALYLVVDVTAEGGRPTFSGGSRFAITTAGGTLDIGLKAVTPSADRVVADARE
jgi:hypothetical protein